MKLSVTRKGLPRARHAVSHRAVAAAVAILLAVGVSGCAPQPSASDPDSTPSQAATMAGTSATAAATPTRSASGMTTSATASSTPSRTATRMTTSAASSVSPTRSTTGTAASTTKQSTPNAFVLPEPRKDAIAHARMVAGSQTATFGDGAQKGVTYSVHAACDGRTSDTMSYELVVDDELVSGGLWSCGADIVNSGFESRGGEMVEIRLLAETATGKFDSMAEVIPSTP